MTGPTAAAAAAKPDLNLLMIATLVVVLALLPYIWRNPIRGVYVQVAALSIFDARSLGFPDSVLDWVPFYQSLNATNTPPNFSITPAELLLAFTLLAWWVRSRQDERLAAKGPLVKAYLVYGAMIGLAELNAALTGGDLSIAVWEIRPQIYGLAMFLITAGLLRERAQILRLMIIFLVGTAITGLVGTWRYLVTYQGNIGELEAILSHEDSYFLLLYVFALAVLLVWYRRRALLWVVMGAVPIVIALLENKRRAGMLALYVGLALIVILAIRYEPRLRQKLIIGGAVAAIGLSSFVAVFWNAEYGTAAQVVRPIHSLVEPDPRDLSSNLYRDAENANLIATYHESPLVGIGFGKPMLIIWPMSDISQIYPYWQYMTHNSILWIGMRMGILGYMAFWGLIGMAILEATRQMGSRADPFIRALGTFALAAVAGELLVAYADLQWETFRNLFFFGATLGMIHSLKYLTEATPVAASEPVEKSNAPPPRHRRPQGWAGSRV